MIGRFLERPRGYQMRSPTFTAPQRRAGVCHASMTKCVTVCRLFIHVGQHVCHTCLPTCMTVCRALKISFVNLYRPIRWLVGVWIRVDCVCGRVASVPNVCPISSANKDGFAVRICDMLAFSDYNVLFGSGSFWFVQSCSYLLILIYPC